MTVYSIVNATVRRRRRSAEDTAEAKARKPLRRAAPRPDVADQVTSEFRALNKMGRTRGSTR